MKRVELLAQYTFSDGVYNAIVTAVLFGGTGAAVFFYIRSIRKRRAEQAYREWLLQKHRMEMQKRWEQLAEKLEESPGDQALHAEIYRLVSNNVFLSALVYRAALKTVQATNGSPATKQFALHVGRLNTGSSRPEGKCTVYDEQAIQNDIESRTCG